LIYDGITFTRPKDILLYLCEKHPEKGLIPEDEESKKKVMYWVDRFFNEWDSIYEFSFYSGNNQRMWPHRLVRGPFTKEPAPPVLEEVNRDERLAKLGEDPEFKAIVA